MDKMIFPRAFAFAVDDLGWNEGSDLSINNPKGPHRAGVKRRFDLHDYKAIVAAGMVVGARIQCLFILSEMDRENILAKFPTTTFQREKWNNSFRVNEEQKIIMNYVRDQAAFMEFGFHGTGHEYWPPNDVQKRAEWYNLHDRAPWPEESLREHIQCFKDIMAQYGINRSNGHSFPESFVPCAYSYYWNPAGEYSLGTLLTEAGVKYANTDFSQIPELSPPGEINGGGFDYGTHVINRINYGNLWYELATLPVIPLAEQQTDIIESHWPNWLAQDDFLQGTVTDKWVEYYRLVQRTPYRYIAKNTEQLHSQWLYNRYAKVVEIAPGCLSIDNTAMPDEAYRYGTLGNMVLKIQLNSGDHISSAMLNGKALGGYFEDEQNGFLYLPVLERRKYELRFEVGRAVIPLHVFLDGTYNLYAFDYSDSEVKIDVKVYGSQSIRLFGWRSGNATSGSNQIVIENINSDPSETILQVRATDMQGSRGVITFKP